MFQGFTGWHALILLAIILLLFGATKLPALAKSVGQSMKAFRSEMKTDDSAGSGDTKSTGESSESAKDSAPSDKS
jgi:sec-independent protein translocase protein TatA